LRFGDLAFWLKHFQLEANMSKIVKVGLIGAGFVTDLHAFSFQKYVPNAEVVAVASVTPGKAAHFAKERNIPYAFDNYRDLLALQDIDVVTVAIPNDLHAQVTSDAARAGKHVICEKPLCKTLEEADQMIAECQKHGVLLLYAEELLFAPKYVRAKTLIDEGALGKVFLAKQMEEHSGPHMPWF
jgi:myo-inositol 2-dehydrogenase / D-chiro-inositol 1-dehydrogenase